MQNKTALWTFVGLLVAACLWQISFTFITSSVESDAKEFAQAKIDSILLVKPDLPSYSIDTLKQGYETEYLNSKANEKYLGFRFYEVRKKQINRGLDLQGGMNVTLEVSLVDLLKNLSNDPNDPNLLKAISEAQQMQKNSGADFITLFATAYKNVAPNNRLASLFRSRENKNLIPMEATDEEVLAIIQEQASGAVQRTEQVLRRRIDNLGVVQPKIQRLESGRILVELPGIKEKERVRKVLQGTAKLEFWETYDNQEIFNNLMKANDFLKSEIKMLEDSGSVASNTENKTSDTTKVSSEMKELLGENTENKDSASINQTEKNPLFDVLGPALSDGGKNVAQGPVVGYSFFKDTAKVNAYLQRDDIKSLFPRLKFLWSAQPSGENKDVLQLFAVKVTNLEGTAPLEGDVVADARRDADPMGRPEVSLLMNAEGAKKWKILTKENIGKAVAIVLDDRVYSAPVVQGEIGGGMTSISGSFSIEDAEDLANVLKAGKLPAPAKIIEEAVVGPTLGKENISKGFYSFLIALLVVLGYMVFYYSKSGAVANITLVTNVFFIVGVLASIGATLTLPGIAGIVLTIGMAVDANVIIFERIREELRQGKGVRLALQDGYKNALSSIIDANITTLLASVILLAFGTGPIQGFATTLLIGILTSVFSSLIISRLIFEWMLDRNMNLQFETSMTKDWFTKTNIGFVNKRKTFYVVSTILVIGSLASIFTKGFDLGVDFSGGRSYQVRFENSVSSENVAQILSNNFVENGNKMTPEVKTFGTANQLLITTKYMINETGQEAEEKVAQTLEAGLKTLNIPYEITSSQMVGPTVADDIKTSAFWSVLIALLGIFLYIVLRFSKWQFGLGAVLALFHDVIIVLGIFSAFYGLLPFTLEIDQAFIAAILTVVGYSINDTVIIFDRIREYLGISAHKRDGNSKIINEALNSTLGRTFNTSFTTFIVLLLMFLFGGDTIKGFVFAILVGIVVGTYSSLFIAAPVVVDLDKSKDQNG